MIISICSAKGGIGKTTTAVNLAAAISIKKKRSKVLVVDWDSQGGATHNLSSSFKGNFRASLYDVLEDQCDTEYATHKYSDNLFLIPTEEEFAKISEKELEEKIEPFIETIRGNYDYIFFDLSPAIYYGSFLPLAFSDKAIIPCSTSGGLSLLGVQSQLNTLEKLNELGSKVELLGILPTLVDRTKLTKDVLAFLQTEYKKICFNSYIRRNTHLAQSSSLGKMVFDFKPNCNGANDYEELAIEVLKRLKKKRSK